MGASRWGGTPPYGLFFLGRRTGIFAVRFGRVVNGGGGGAGAVPCGFAARAGRGLLRQEFGKVERGLGGGDTHGSVLSGQSDLGFPAGRKACPIPGPPARHAPRVRRAVAGMRLLWGER